MTDKPPRPVAERKKPLPIRSYSDAPTVDNPVWQKVAKALRARRDELNLRQRDVSDAAGVSFTSYTPIETGKLVYVPSAKVRRNISTALGWEPDGIDRLLKGRRPVVVNPDPPTTPGGSVVLLAEEMAARAAARAIGTGKILSDADRKQLARAFEEALRAEGYE